ncbi:MAG: trypsin-like peptidase domain-containing protein [Planctomycetota bacterium]
MANLREYVEELLETPDGVELAFRHLKSQCAPGNPLRNAALTGICEWNELDSKMIEGTITDADATVQKSRLRVRLLKLADRLDRDRPIESEMRTILERHQAIAEETKNDDTVAASSLATWSQTLLSESQLESAPQPDQPLAAITLSTRALSVSESVRRMLRLKRQICAVMVDDGHVGTAFLISDRYVLTNRHVLDEALHRSGVRSCVFDHAGEKSVSGLPRIDLSPQLVPELSPGVQALSDVRDLDYAVLELERSVEESRGCLAPADVQMRDKDPVIILHHPTAEDGCSASPLQASVGAIRDVNGFANRFAYTAATAPGSSGSPVLSAAFELIGIHHHQQQNVNSHGIPIKAIVEDLRCKGFTSFG